MTRPEPASVPCDVEGCTHPSRFIGNDPQQPEGKCECHSWNCTYPQLYGTTACHRDYPQDFAPPAGTICGAFGCETPAVVRTVRGNEWFPGWYCAEHGAPPPNAPSPAERTAQNVDDNLADHTARTLAQNAASPSLTNND